MGKASLSTPVLVAGAGNSVSIATQNIPSKNSFSPNQGCLPLDHGTHPEKPHPMLCARNPGALGASQKSRGQKEERTGLLAMTSTSRFLSYSEVLLSQVLGTSAGKRGHTSTFPPTRNYFWVFYAVSLACLFLYYYRTISIPIDL